MFRDNASPLCSIAANQPRSRRVETFGGRQRLHAAATALTCRAPLTRCHGASPRFAAIRTDFPVRETRNHGSRSSNRSRATGANFSEANLVPSRRYTVENCESYWGLQAVAAAG